MKVMRIDWKKVRHIMLERGVKSDAELTRKAKIHPNAFATSGPFMSTTAERIANVLDCDPWEFITFSELEGARNG